MKRSSPQNTEPNAFSLEQHHRTATSVQHYPPLTLFLLASPPYPIGPSTPEADVVASQKRIGRRWVNREGRRTRYDRTGDAAFVPYFRRPDFIFFRSASCKTDLIHATLRTVNLLPADHVAASSFSSPTSTSRTPLLVLHGIAVTTDLRRLTGNVIFDIPSACSPSCCRHRLLPRQHRLQATTSYRHLTATLAADAALQAFNHSAERLGLPPAPPSSDAQRRPLRRPAAPKTPTVGRPPPSSIRFAAWGCQAAYTRPGRQRGHPPHWDGRQPQARGETAYHQNIS